MEEIKEDLVEQKMAEQEPAAKKVPTAKLYCKLHNTDAEYFSSS